MEISCRKLNKIESDYYQALIDEPDLIKQDTEKVIILVNKNCLLVQAQCVMPWIYSHGYIKTYGTKNDSYNSLLSCAVDDFIALNYIH